ncbi:asparagine synthase (glutamine-hydrolyzing) [Pelistega ratti]|uniref:asparagine synthase (glutamine-hydrolyzing) n=1 Tax=Pelistega ratti TaxID=2652177 RepID=UPI001358BF89|nr:asparagine synthase (glutamine-hydrolyzing) [Pelistega ratti]
MCGIIGLIGSFEHKQQVLEQACRRIKERGPDSEGVWLSPQQHIGLAHVRLAIQDLSHQGHQPMHSENQRYVLVFNGEIYNHLSLRGQINDKQWRGHSDTETLLACFEQWGVEETLKQVVGMFVFALWDKEKETLVLGRDRFGEKPLYYARSAKGLLFASDLKALMPIDGFSRTLNKKAVTLFLRHNYIPAPYTIFDQTYKLPPASYLVFTKDQLFHQYEWSMPKEYWSAYEVAKRSSDRLFTSDEAAIDAFDGVLSSAIKDQMLADVKLGAFLSGGTDSSLIAALMQKQSDVPVKTFSIGFKEEQYNEADYAKAVAQHLQTDHTELYMGAEDSLALVEYLPSVYSEPFADSSQLPVLMMMQMTAKQVKVALSGDAGDELFGGYNRYHRVLKWWDYRHKVPKILRPILADICMGMSKQFTSLERQIKWQQLAMVLKAKNSVAFYKPFVSYWKKPAQLVPGTQELPDPFTHHHLRSVLETMMITDTLSYLPDDILVKVDRAAMYYSLETRVPLLDHRVFEFVWDIHPSYKCREGTSKWLMKSLLYRYVPPALLDRPKKGFSVPLGQWLRAPLKAWATDLLSSQRIKQQGLLNDKLIQQVWQEHQSGKSDWSAQLWGLLMLQAWLDAYDISV